LIVRVLAMVLVWSACAAAQVQLPAVTHDHAVSRGAWTQGVACLEDSTQTYSLYLPPQYDDTRRWPALLVFDPRGRSLQAGDRFRRAAEEFGWIIISSNDTRSDTSWEPNARALRALWPEVHQRHGIDPERIYAAGFSGGVLVAWYLAQFADPPTLAGILSAGGRPAEEIPVNAIAFAHFGTTGRFDFNHAPMKALDRIVADAGAPHQLRFFDGGHQWMPASLAWEGIAWMEILAMRDGRRRLDRRLSERLYHHDLAGADSLERCGEALQALRRLEVMHDTWHGLRDLRGLEKRIRRLRSSNVVATQRDAERQADRWEIEHQQECIPLLEELESGTSSRTWEEIVDELDLSSLHERARDRSQDGDAAQRVLEWTFTRTSFYIPRKLRGDGNDAQAAVALRIAASIHPQRPWVWFRLARARAACGMLDAANVALRRAVETGFTQVQLLETDGDLAPLRDTAAYRETLSMLRPPARSDDGPR
jgi:predicted esterase